MQVVDYDEDIGNQNDKPSILPFPLSQPLIITSIAFWQHLLMHRLQNSFTNIKEKQFSAGLKHGSKRCSLTVLPIRYSTGILNALLVLINLPLITLSLMNPLIQTSSHSPKNYGRDMQVEIMAISHQARKWVSPLVLFKI